MGNTHGVADMAYELQTTTGDLLPACVVSTTWPTVPGSGLTLGAFSTKAYVRAGQQLTYVDQPAVTVTIVGGDGTYWLSVTDDTFSAFAGWTRRDGSHYMWRLSATRPSDVDNLLVFSQLTVSGGNITAVSTPTGVTRAEALRALSGLGTMATQNANAVAITGGGAQLGGMATPYWLAAPNAQIDVLYGNVQLSGNLGIGKVPGHPLEILYNRNTQYGLIIIPSADSGAGTTAIFHNAAGSIVGSISTTGSATAYNTSSDARLKHAITPLTDSLAVLDRLNPISHLWKADNSYGEGFLAHELQQELAFAVTGEPDAVDAQGQILPQQADYSKLVPRLTAVLKELWAQVQALTARVAQLEGAV